MFQNIIYLLPYSTRRALYATLKYSDYKRLQNYRTIETETGYSLKPFDKYKCIFVHIPKAAGVSVCRSMFGNLAGGHITLQQYQAIFSRVEFDQYFKFTFVRNPWSRLFSAYNFLKNGGMYETDRMWAAENLAQYDSFEEFVIKWVNIANIERYVHFAPQYKYICIKYNNEILLDFIGFFENIQNDFEFIQNVLSPDVDISIRHENKTVSDGEEPDYREVYTNEMRNIVSEAYSKDIDLLGYSFNNDSLETQLRKRSVRPLLKL